MGPKAKKKLKISDFFQSEVYDSAQILPTLQLSSLPSLHILTLLHFHELLLV